MHKALRPLLCTESLPMHKALCPLLFTESLPIGEPWCCACRDDNTHEYG
jgi:hypothetical protein